MTTNSPLPRACLEVRLPAKCCYSAMSDALEERPDNHCLGLGALRLPEIPRAAAVTSRLWKPGRTLLVKFLGGTNVQRRVVWQAFARWQAAANLGFKHQTVRSGPSHLRVGFDFRAGSWSFIGTDALSVPSTRPTMNIGWGPDLPTCLHETGHALWLIHEHSNPLGSIPWDVAKVHRYYEGPPNHWDANTVKANVLDVYDAKVLTNGGFDPRSIMLYPVPAELLTDPSKAVGWNRDLSPGDLRFVQNAYPGRELTTSLEEAARQELKKLLKG